MTNRAASTYDRWQAPLALLERGGLRAPVAVGFLARIALTTALYRWTTEPVWGDDVGYIRSARYLLEHGQLENHHFPVGYSLFVACWLGLTGSFAVIRLAHVLLGSLTIAVVGKLAGELYGSRAGLAAAWLTALYPPLIFMTGRIMSETLFITLLMLSIQQFLAGDRTGSLKHSLYGAAYFAVGSVVRSNLMVMLPFIPLWHLLKPGATWRTRLRNAVATGAVAGVIVLLPGLYFLQTQGRFIPSATNAGQTFYGANNPLADGGWVEMENHQELLASIPPEVRKDRVLYNKAQFQLGVEWVKQNPGAFVGLLPKKFGNAWIPGFQSSETTSSSKFAALVLILVNVPLLLAALAGRVTQRPLRRDGLLLAVLATYTLMSLAFYGNPRIGLFVSPLLIVYASSLVGRLLDPPSRAAAGGT
jgi:4-amino-4-deoxy-L-arabinose transferase-like glycosyltransferase